MKKKISLGWALCGALLLSAICCVLMFFIRPMPAKANFTNEMKLSNPNPLNDSGADALDRVGDHENSPYFYQADFYNMSSTNSRTIFPHFKTIQQSASWSCGPSIIMMVQEYYGVLDDWNEESLAALRTDHSEQHLGTCLEQMIEILDGVGSFDLVTTYDYQGKTDGINWAFFQEQIQAGYPVVIGWNDWGGHWEVVIGYDTMGTEHVDDDVLIVADPFDTSDHNQDGYGVVNAKRFIANFTYYDFFPEDHINDKCFIVVKPSNIGDAVKIAS